MAYASYERYTPPCVSVFPRRLWGHSAQAMRARDTVQDSAQAMRAKTGHVLQYSSKNRFTHFLHRLIYCSQRKMWRKMAAGRRIAPQEDKWPNNRRRPQHHSSHTLFQQNFLANCTGLAALVCQRAA